MQFFGHCGRGGRRLGAITRRPKNDGVKRKRHTLCSVTPIVIQTWGAAIRNPNANERLRAEFLRQYGKPLERVRGVRAARGGSVHQLYRDSDSKLIRLRTSMDGVLVTKAIGPNPYDADAPVVLEGRQDFIGFAMPGPRGTVECFLIPNDRAIADIKEVHGRWLVTKPGSESDVRALFFYGEVEMHGKPW